MAETLKDWLSGSLPEHVDASILESGTDYEPGLPQDDLKLGDENASMEALLEVADSLYQLHCDIREAGGMSQSFAMEAQELMVGFDKDTPLAFYTKNPSRTRLAIANEEINKGMWAAIAAGVAALLAVLYKVIRWMFGSSSSSNSSSPSSSSSSSSSAATPVEKAKEITKEAEEAAKAAPHAVSETKISAEDTIHEVEEPLGAFRELLKNDIPLPTPTNGGPVFMFIDNQPVAVKTVGDVMTGICANRNKERSAETDAIRELSKVTDYELDLIEVGPYTASVAELTSQLQDFTRLSKDRLKLIREFLSEYGNWFEPHHETDDSEDIPRYLSDSIARMNEQLEKMPPNELVWMGKRVPANEISSLMREKREELRAKKPEDAYIYRKMMDDVLQSVRPGKALLKIADSIVPMSNQLLELARGVEEVTIFIDGGIQNRSGTGVMSADASNQISRQLGALHKDIMEVSQLALVLRTWVKDWHGAMNLSLNTRRHVAHTFANGLVDSDRNNVALPQWRETASTFSKIIVSFRDKFWAWIDDPANRRKV